MRGTAPLDKIHWVSFRNTASEDAPAYGVMRITGEEVRAGRTVYLIDKPDDSIQQRYLINGPIPVPPGDDIIGDGTFDITYALCDSSASPSRGQHWGAKDDSWKLWQHRMGFYVLGNYQGSGATQRAIVEPYLLLKVRCVLNADLNQGSSASASVFFRDGATWTDSLVDITVYDDLLAVGDAVASGDIVWADWYGDRWWVYAAECTTA